MARKETEVKKSILKTVTTGGIKKTTSTISKTSRFQESTVKCRNKSTAFVRNPATMAVKLETIAEEPEEINETEPVKQEPFEDDEMDVDWEKMADDAEAGIFKRLMYMDGREWIERRFCTGLIAADMALG
ncbi:uncharacterized protein CLAFUR5_05295 [Fulvia fulva]|uniref:Uncharacterized protein n=1 Tax=Passalora fulva TaxID=5499 RepID=A0A9Q8P7B8_PASFU|nr:uncharacterized protein CLAFUR5_05295 [Fulvia fulva]KAK4617191.1 hypothetical protein CLAFUR0_10557 [Fulvia fulva]UJO15856.1 hypothetical protein CLAFUR5_05295 [Fulvia fulva]